MELAEDVYRRLNAAGIETVLDDRPERAGVKFKDADLIGYPLRITVGSKAVAESQLEVRIRRGGAVIMTPAAEIESGVKALLQGL